ncbi:MAG: diguanylate cyclase [Acidobacteria bacterium]|nr:diguanylate cyclase [Acidobacteriota bacterium]
MSALDRRRTDADHGDPAPLRALIVDDDEQYRAYLKAMVRRQGFAVTTAGDGAEAVTLMHDCLAFDLIIVDCEMPRMNGLELIATLRRNPVCADTYSMMLTGRTDVETKITALREGFDDFLVKSSQEIELVAKLGAARRLITRQRRLDATVRELYGLATRDELTGLFNRRFFFGEAERMLADGVDVSLVFFDLDDFKRINDNFGHLAGDRILRDVGALFLRRTRHEDLIARYGGDEFVMLVTKLRVEEVDAFAARLAREIGGMQWVFGSDTLSVSVSTGYGCSELLAHPSVAQLLSAGDRDLYKNKWLRQNPTLDPSVYEYDQRQGERHELVEFPEAGGTEERKKDEAPST